MKKIAVAILIFIMLLPLAGAVVEEDWGKYTRIDETKRDASGNNVTLSWLKKSYTNENGNYTVTVSDFDAQGIVVLDVTYKGKSEKILLRGEWDANGTRFIADRAEAFNKTMFLTLNRIVSPSGVFACCPEAEINIDLIRPELFLEFKKDTRNFTTSYLLVNPFANWTYDPYTDPTSNLSENTTINVEETVNSYHMNEDIPIEIEITNHGDAESTFTEVFIDTDGLQFDYGYPYYQLPTMAGENQQNFIAPTNQTLKLKLKFPQPPTKLNYTVHAYVKGMKGDTTYYYDDTTDITLLPSVTVTKSATKESMLVSRKDIEDIYPSVNPDEISKWLTVGDIYVTLGVTNYQNHEIKNIKLNDTLNRQFTTENGSLNWSFDLKPFETKEFKYKLDATRPGRFTLPPALLSYSEMNMPWWVVSDTPSVQVHGPCVQVFKRPDKPVLNIGENTTITLTFRNSGDMPSKVRINDKLPENATFLQGNMYYEGIVLPGDSPAISYAILMDKEGQTTLPDPEVQVNGKENSCGQTISGSILVKELAPSPPATIQIPAETPQQDQVPKPVESNWLEGAIPALMLVLAIMVLFILQRS
ncbi:Uncharacterised protein [uncultured archaeon]|nr:Uncharacterised protein [uncultured archaeon]